MEIEVAWDPEALSAIRKAYNYLRQHSQGAADRLADDLVQFGDSLKYLQLKFKVCTKPELKRRKMHCITYKMHIFVYKLVGNQLRIYKIYHAKRNPRKLTLRKRK